MSTYLPTIFGENLMDMFDDFDRNFFRGFGHPDRALYGKHAPNMMKTDVKETDNGYEVDVELPGFKKEDIKIDVENDCLTITAERKADEEEKQKNFIKRERFYGSFSRSFDVSGVNVDGIEAAYNDGILKLTMPKKVETVPPTRRLEIK